MLGGICMFYSLCAHEYADFVDLCQALCEPAGGGGHEGFC